MWLWKVFYGLFMAWVFSFDRPPSPQSWVSLRLADLHPQPKLCHPCPLCDWMCKYCSHIFMNCRWIEPRGLRSTLGHFRCCGRRIHRILQRAQEGFLPMHPQKLFHSSLSIYPTHQIISMSYTLQNKSHAPKHISFYRSVSLSMLVLRLLAIFGRGDWFCRSLQRAWEGSLSLSLV